VPSRTPEAAGPTGSRSDLAPHAAPRANAMRARAKWVRDIEA
jgi:hypothetical protein